MDEKEVMSVGDRLRYARGDRSQAEVAQAVGLSVMAISKLESDQIKPSYDTMLKLARFFHTSADKLFF
jgi:transcriptional regulator with XRE-family HTH domain